MIRRLAGFSSPTALAAAMQIMLAAPGSAQTGCPEPVKPVEHDLRAQIQGQLSAIGRLGAGQIEARTERTAQDLISKYPNADRVAITQNLLSVFCNQLYRSRTLSESQKFELFFKMQERMERMLIPDYDVGVGSNDSKRIRPRFNEQ